MSEVAEQMIGPSASIVGRRVDFGTPGEGEGLSWGIEVDLDVTDPMVRSRIEGYRFELPPPY